ncbi:12256_t:CDS:2 [Cetraspora pellucida]|uniref:12256_t:CDS:1 n=1 Tax=Cetraspora pellucida TaxID=1433469 RepID=A0A9N9PE20_9GLOM|nr:12256_t:CDS:2 [Cetraspora pellucida]
MSLIENYNFAQYELEHFMYNTEHKSQPLASITSSINNSEDTATSFKKRYSKLFLEGLFEENKRKTWLYKNNDSNTTNLWCHLEHYHPDSDSRSKEEPFEFIQLAFKKLLNK